MKYQIVMSKAQKVAFDIEVFFDKAISKQDFLKQNVSTLLPCDQEAVKALFNLAFEPLRQDEKRYCFPIKKSKASQVLYKLALTKQLYHQNEKIIYEPFSKAKFYYQVTRLNDLYEITGMFEIGKFKTNVKECALVFEGDEIFYLHKGILSKVDTECDFLWIEKVFKSPIQVSKKELDDLLKDIKLDNLAPKIKFEEGLELQETISCTPELVLKDPSGQFAELWMDYGSFGRVEFGKKEKLKIERNFIEESGWEKDLIESGYLKKRGPFFSYACDKKDLKKTLRFLLELGWKILHVNKKALKLMSKNDLSLDLKGEALTLQGDVTFEDQKVTLDEISKAIKQDQNFVTLSDNFVGLLEGFNFAKYFTKEQGFTLPKRQLGLLDEAQNVTISSSLQKLLSLQKQEIGAAHLPDDFKGKLFDYQKTGYDWLRFLYQHRFGGLLADEMGLGKTVQVLAFLAFLGLGKSHLIVVPSALKMNWAKECEKFLGFKANIYQSSKDHITSGIWIISYAMLRERFSHFKDKTFDTLILDEAQMIKNPDAKTSKVVFEISAHFKLAISGTPIENKPLDLWSITHFLNPGLFSERKAFEIEQKDPLQRKKLSKLIKPFILRRKKEEVGLDLPERIEQTVYIELSEVESAIYQRILTRAKEELSSEHKPLEVLEALLRLRQVCCHPFLAKEEGSSSKLEKVLLDTEEIVSSGRKLMIVSQFTSLLALIKKELENKSLSYLTIDGSTKDKQSIVDSFQEGSCQILLMSLKAGGVGLNITKADYVLIYDPWWNNAAEEQAIARAHRIGREKTVFVKRYVALETIEEKIQKLKEEKSALFTQVIDFEGNGQFSESEVLESLLL